MIAMWGLSLWLPVVHFQTINGPQIVNHGAEVLSIGWLGFLIGQFGWLANLTFFLLVFTPLIVRDMPRWLFLGVLALHVLLTMTAFGWDTYPSNEGMPESHNIDQYFAGYWVWLGVMASTAVYSMTGFGWRRLVSR